MDYGIGLDVGTAFIGSARKNEEGKEIYRYQRDCFLQIEADSDSKKMLEQAGANFVESEENEEIYIIGEDAIKFANILSASNNTLLRRPMASGVLNPNEPELAYYIIVEIIRSVLGEPRVPGETVCFSVPADPIDAQFNNMYHQRMIEGALESLGFTPKPINEALAIIYATNPTIENEDDGIVNFTGVACSFGGGQVNVCFAYRSLPLVKFSIANAYGMNEGSAGDWIDKQVARTRADMSISKITKFKEQHANFTKDPMILAAEISKNKREEAKNRELLVALDLYYRKLVDYVLEALSNKFKSQGESVEDPVEIVLAGGTSMPEGFEKLVQEEVNKIELPFEVKNVRKASNPMYTVSSGCLVGAITAMREK
jgi:hypothetical protein